MHALRHLPLLLLLAACRNTEESAPAMPAVESPGAEAARLASAGQLEEARELLSEAVATGHLDEARARLDAGDVRGAHDALGEALALIPPSARSEGLRSEIEDGLFTLALGEGRDLLATGDPRDAMLPLDDAFKISPSDAELRFIRGCAMLRIGMEDGDGFLFEDALRNLQRAARSGQRPAAWYGVARAEFQLYEDRDPRRIARALAAVRRGDAARVEDSVDEVLLPEPAERTASTVLMWASSLAADGQLVDEDPADLRAEWRTHATALVGLTPEDPWAWNQVALSYKWDGAFLQARETARRGVPHAPEDEALHATLTSSAREAGGAAAVLEDYSALAAELPESPLCQWNLGLASFAVGVARLQADSSDQSEHFKAAETAFRTARELDASRTEASIGYEVVSRGGLGWSHLYAGRLDASRDAFLSMEDKLEGGLHWEFEGRLKSGIKGLEHVIFRYSQRWDDEALDTEDRFRGLEKAAMLSSTLHEYAPLNGSFANNAGFFHRDAGVALNDFAKPLAAALFADDAPTGPERDQLLQRARELTRRAEEHMRSSYAAYVEAAKLIPHDARTVNDCALVLVYYLRDDDQAAELMLGNALNAGRAQLELDDLTDDQRYAIENAIGDAYQNLGYLELTIRQHPIEARLWFEKSLEIGPDPRPVIKTTFLPQCQKLLADELSDADIAESYRWPVALPD